jgi:hypothetical protein
MRTPTHRMRPLGRVLLALTTALAAALLVVATALADSHLRDATGASKLSDTQIREANGSITTCPPGTHVTTQSNGQGGFIYVCVR